MPVYYVQIPVTGYVTVNIRAESKEEAMGLAFGYADLNDKAQWGEFEFHEHVTRGNMVRAVLNSINATEAKGEDFAHNDVEPGEEE